MGVGSASSAAIATEWGGRNRDLNDSILVRTAK